MGHRDSSWQWFMEHGFSSLVQLSNPHIGHENKADRWNCQPNNCKHLFDFQELLQTTPALIHCTLVECACKCMLCRLNNSMDDYIIGILRALTFIFSLDKWFGDYGYTGDLFKTCLIIYEVAQCSLWSLILPCHRQISELKLVSDNNILE